MLCFRSYNWFVSHFCFPFTNSYPLHRHVVGVINKFHNDSEPHTLSYPVFLQQFQETKRREKQVFREVMTKGGHVSGDETILCTTPSLFYTIDMILLRWLETCLSGALEKLKRLGLRALVCF